MMKIAAASYHCERHPDWAAHKAKLDKIFETASADLIVVPEYAGLEAALIDGPATADPVWWRDAAAERAQDWVNQFTHLAMTHSTHVLAGSGPVHTERGVVNRSWLISPSGAVHWQDKMILTPYERDAMHMVPGEALTLAETALGKIGVMICYDSEFPILARAFVAAGAQMLLVPSCTDQAAGQTRVRQSCRARAIESQCLVVQAPLVGAVSGCDIIDQSTGQCGFFCPPDYGLPSDGILGQGPSDVAEVTTLEVDPAAIAAPRGTGQVGNFAHWTEQDQRLSLVTTRPLD